MKIEIRESILYSWLKHIKECQIVQLNWKASNKWELKNKEKLEELINYQANTFFKNMGITYIKEQNLSINSLVKLKLMFLESIMSTKGEAKSLPLT